MARKKSRKKSSKPACRKRMSGSKISAVEEIAWGIGGAMTGAFAKKVIPTSWGALAASGIVAGAPIAASFAAPKMMKDPRARAFGIGMSSYGSVGVVNVVAPKLLSGIGGVSMIAGFDELRGMGALNTGMAYKGLPTVGRVSTVAGTNDDYMSALAEELEAA